MGSGCSGSLGMPMRLTISIAALIAGLMLSPHLSAQNTKWNNSPLPKSAYVGKKSPAAPPRDLSGIWNGEAEGGVQAKGVLEYPALFPNDRADSDGGHADETGILRPLSYTPAGLAALKLNKPAVGVRAVPAGLTNNRVDICDPVGFPGMEFFELRVIQIAQTKNQVLVLNQFQTVWRVVWTDGRQLPIKDLGTRWNGYSVGKWVDDYTLVVQTVGMDERAWLDNAGRPHSADMRVEERWHRIDYDTLELTVTIDDPTFYTQPWQALNKFVLHRLPDDYDMTDFSCSAIEIQEYNKEIGNPVAAGQSQNSP